MKTLRSAFWLLTILLVTTPAFAGPGDERDRRIEQLEKTVQTLMEEIDDLAKFLVAASEAARREPETK